VIDQMPSGVVVVDARGRLIQMNEAARGIWAASPTAGQPVMQQTASFHAYEPKSGRPLAIPEMPVARALKGERVQGFEYISRRQPDDAEAWLQASAVPLRDAEGQISGAVAVFSDVTAERRLVRDLAASEEQLRTLYQALACGVLVRDTDGRITQVNRVAEEVIGIPSDQMLGQTTRSLWDARGEDGAALSEEERQDMLRQALDSRRPVRKLTRRVTRPDGEHRWIQVDTVPVLNPEGEPVQVVSSFIDITERKQAEEARARLAAILEATPDYVSILDAEGRRIYVNRAGRAMLGRGDDDDNDISDLTIYDNRPEWARAVIRDEAIPIAVRDGVWAGETALLDSDGREIPISAVLLAQRGPDGEVEYFSIIGRDITELKRAEHEIQQLNAVLEQRVVERTAQLEAANRELEAFSYSVAHDLRAPLRAMDGFSRILLEEYAADLAADVQRYLRLVRENAQQMGHLVDDLLSFSRLSRQPLTKERVAPDDLVRQILADLRHEQEGRRVEITIDQLPPCLADPGLLREVWVNFLVNALKFTRSRELATIHVGARQEDGECVYFVKDNGVGFDSRYADKLFGVFQRLHRAEDYEGTGVGLAIVQRIVHRHGGRVWAESELNHGTTFYFMLGGSPDA
jgi:PAS domain S-box-containing protein